MKNRNGITLISLIITIIVLSIIASIAIYSGSEVIKSSKFTKFTTEMKIMQVKVNELYENNKNGDLGKEIKSTSEVKTQASKVFKESTSGITDQTGYYYFDQATINELGIEGVEGEFFINIEKRSIISYKGFKYEGEVYYTLEQLPNGLYNVEYEDKNAGKIPTFDVSYEVIGNDKYRITISNIQYSGYIDKWEVKYQKDGENYWNTSEDLTFIIEDEGDYKIKIVNGDISSEVKTEHFE